MNPGTTSESAAQRSSTIEHTSLRTGRSYVDLVLAFERERRHLDPAISQRLIERKAAWSASSAKSPE